MTSPIVYALAPNIEEHPADLEWSANIPQRAEYRNGNGKTPGTLWERIAEATPTRPTTSTWAKTPEMRAMRAAVGNGPLVRDHINVK